MGLLRLAGFSGMWPIRDSRALPDNAAVSARNTDCDGGAYLQGNRGHTLIKALTSTARSVFRIPAGTVIPPSEEAPSSAVWLEFTDINTNLFRGPIINDLHQRYYWGSPTVGIRYAPRTLLDTVPTNADFWGYALGVQPPTSPPTGSVSGGSTPVITRQYLVTFENIYGEESQPSLPVEIEGYANGVWNISNIPQPPATGIYAPTNAIRLYRTITSTSGLTDYYLVERLGVGTTSYADGRIDTDLIIPLESISYALPPSGTQGLVLMPNGILVAWKDNNLYFSENFRPHAWPPEYTMTVDAPIVGLAVYGNSCVVCTTGRPSIVTGTKAGSMALQKTDAVLPCVGRGSIAAAPEGVYYASEEGLVLVSPGAISTVTKELISREQWRNTEPRYYRAMMQGGEYVALTYTSSPTFNGWRFWPQKPETRGVVYFDLAELPVNIGIEPLTGKPWLIVFEGGVYNLYEWETPGAARVSYEWISKEFVYPYPANFSVYQAYFDDTLTKTLNLKVEVTLRGNDGSTEWAVVYDRPVVASGKEIKLPSGFKSDVWRFTFSGNTELQSFVIASSARELRSA
jgi:hypothetical protein